MKSTLLLVLLGIASLGVTARGEGLWVTDFEAAKVQAKAENRYLLLDFSGSDWCGWCIKLDREVFSQREFKEYAKQELVCVLLDFPNRKALAPELQARKSSLSADDQAYIAGLKADATVPTP